LLFLAFFHESITVASLLYYFLVFDYYNVSPTRLFGTADTYWQQGAPPFLAGGGVVYTDDEQVTILIKAQTAEWAMLTCGQVFHIWFCKTRLISLFDWEHLTSNSHLIMGVVVEILMITIIVFTPISHNYFADPFPGILWLVLLPILFFLFMLNEPRKYLARTRPHGWVARNLIF